MAKSITYTPLLAFEKIFTYTLFYERCSTVLACDERIIDSTNLVVTSYFDPQLTMVFSPFLKFPLVLVSDHLLVGQITVYNCAHQVAPDEKLILASLGSTIVAIVAPGKWAVKGS